MNKKTYEKRKEMDEKHAEGMADNVKGMDSAFILRYIYCELIKTRLALERMEKER